MLIISDNYFNSPFCVSELGATWVLAKIKDIKIIPLILPMVDTKQLEKTPLKNLQYIVIDESNLSLIIDDISNKGIENKGTNEINKRVSEFCKVIQNYKLEIILKSKNQLEKVINEVLKAFDEKKWGKARDYLRTIQETILPIIRTEKYKQLVNDFSNNKVDEEYINKIWKEYEALKDDYGIVEDSENLLEKIHPVIRYYELLAKTADDVRIKTKFRKLADPNTTPMERKFIGDELNVLGDIRKGIGVIDEIPDIDWITIPSGNFLFGTDRKTERVTQDFKISRYLITNAQFTEFIKSIDYNDDFNWSHLQGIDYIIRKPDEYKITIPNYPITDISWVEAMAFCNWISKQTNKNIQIPTHFEWQKAARGEKGREYAYSNIANCNLGNTSEHNFRSPIAVGMFPLGASPYGLLDISGNVWEWTYTINSANATEKELEKRVLAGGSFNYGIDRDKVSSFNSMPVNYRSERGGFRIAMYE